MKCCLSSSSILPVMISVTSITAETEEKKKGKVSHYCRMGCSGSVVVCNISQMPSYCESRQFLATMIVCQAKSCGLWSQWGADQSATAEVPFYSAAQREILFRKVKRKVRRMGGGGGIMLLSFPLQKHVWCWSWQLHILPHLPPFPHAWGKKHHSDHIKACRLSVRPVTLQH